MDNHLLTTIDTKKDNVRDPIENGKKQVSEFPKIENVLKTVKRWAAIVLEWIDWSWKGTQSKILTKRLKDLFKV